MNIIQHFMMEDIQKYSYFMDAKETKAYHMYKKIALFLCTCLGCILAYVTEVNLITIQLILFLGVFGCKIPYFILKLRHNHHCNKMVDAIPLWVNMLYSLIGENNIYNAIMLSYEDAPICMKKDLYEFIEKIRVTDSDKDAYLDFLSIYNIDHFKDIMMKLYEFRSLSKDKLKYEISILNESLGSIEHLKREHRHKRELFVADSLTLVMMSIPCIYMFFVSLILSELMLG